MESVTKPQDLPKQNDSNKVKPPDTNEPVIPDETGWNGNEQGLG